MIADLERTDASELSGYDLCIIGSGPAGTTLAAELAGRGLRICVLESGSLAPTARGDRLRAVECEGIRIKDWSRERVLGGASTTWAGLSSAFDEVDFAPRPFVRVPGWPIARSELLPYYAQASQRYRFAPLELFGAGGFADLRAQGELEPRWTAIGEKVFLAAAEPQDFGREQRRVYEREDVDLWLDATALRLECGAHGERIACVRARSSGGRSLAVRAKAFVLAAGGIENPRLLLVSRDRWPEGLGNAHDWVGRCLMNHPKNYFGVVELAGGVRDLPYYFGCLHRGFAGYAGLRFREEEQLARGLLNSYVRLEPLFPWSDSEGVESLVLLAKRSGALFRSWKKKREAEVVALRDYAETGDDSELQNRRRGALGLLALAPRIALDAPAVASYAYYRLKGRAKPIVRRARVRNFLEMEPDPENRVTLGAVRDEYGTPLPRVVHRCTELDRRSLVELHRALESEMQNAGFGRLESSLASADPWPIDQDASHHMGTTRMGLDPKRSVVDPHLRVHGLSNLFVAGSSVFPTSGCANPTFTLVALSIRLARHLELELPSLDRD
jgi:choline dehydrogenase-like flavoprotein